MAAPVNSASHVAIRRKRDGLYLVGYSMVARNWSDKPKFVPSLSRAKTVVRVDLGDDLADYEFPTRDQASS